jgi:hypothetical protein
MTHQPHTPAGRPLDPDGKLAIESLEDATLEEELSVAAMAHVLARDERYQHLLAERQRRELAHA